MLSQEKLEEALLPTLDEMYEVEVEGALNPFRQPIDLTALGITNLSSPAMINAMNLGTIKMKLTTGQYTEVWQYIDDVWLMFEKVWLLNKPKSFVECGKKVYYISIYRNK